MLPNTVAIIDPNLRVYRVQSFLILNPNPLGDAPAVEDLIQFELIHVISINILAHFLLSPDSVIFFDLSPKVDQNVPSIGFQMERGENDA